MRYMNELVELKSLTLAELCDLVQSMGQPCYRGRQIFNWIYKGAESVEEMTDLPLSFRQKLNEHCCMYSAKICKYQQSSDGSANKYLFLLKDNEMVEAVLMRYKYGNSACVSTQAGCRMGCAFCASTIKGLKRNLDRGEMIEQVLQMQKNIGDKISHVVLMGSGEPLDNYEESVAFMRLLHEGLNMSYRNMTLSTCGIVPRIYDLAKEGIPVTLAVSLHAPNDLVRRNIMPVAKAYPIVDLLEACDFYARVTGRRITFEYVMLKDINDMPEHAYKLADILKGRLCHVNLIRFNGVEESEFCASNEKTVKRFYDILNGKGIPVSIRRRMGSDIDAACGQLRRQQSARN